MAPPALRGAGRFPSLVLAPLARTIDTDNRMVSYEGVIVGCGWHE